MAITLKIKNTSTASKVPTFTTDIGIGELAVNVTDEKLYSANSTAVFRIEGPRGSDTEVQFNDSAYSNGSAGFTFNKSTNTVFIGNSTINAVVNSTSVKVMNSTSNSLFSIPTAAEWADGNYFLNANGSWTSPAGGAASVTIAETPPGSPANGDLWWDSSTGEGVLKLRYGDGDSEQWVDATPMIPGAQGDTGPASPKSLSLLKPAASDNLTVFHTDDAITISEIRTTVRGTSPSVTATYKYGASRDGTGETTIQASIVTTNVTSGNIQSSFTDATVDANSWIWVEVTSIGGTVDEYATKLIFSTT